MYFFFIVGVFTSVEVVNVRNEVSNVDFQGRRTTLLEKLVQDNIPHVIRPVAGVLSCEEGWTMSGEPEVGICTLKLVHIFSGWCVCGAGIIFRHNLSLPSVHFLGPVTKLSF